MTGVIRDLDQGRNLELREQLPADDDPTMQVAMRVWGNLTEDEQANVFRGLFKRVVAFERHGRDVGHLEMMEDDLHVMVLLESQPGFTEERRRPFVPPKPGEGIGIEEVIRRLRSEDTSHAE